jgi:hypothetical protein
MPQTLCSDAFSLLNMLDPKLIVLAAVVILIIAGLARLLRAKTQE